ncbi:antitoxin Xre/MbcA/ParS toxin-binding domain-containing protein [Chelativorans alearense]|uniref:antitoxin Xre/MbcA/ParS toxin-binding domain-containing protein n=1 Tax=Chelativorans alearense TaxID=2681495 RepID=UPI001FE40467|nr:antitoxin Xre/MbcA/ParS toxin-binding domain-containing protein [Chelativorans alearense]
MPANAAISAGYGQGTTMLSPDRFEPANRRMLSGPGMRTFLTIADLWGLNETQRRLVLGYPSKSTYQNWRKLAREHKDITLGVDTLTRISAVLGIYQALLVLYTDEAEGWDWLKRPNADRTFGGQRPLDIVTGGTIDGLMTVRRFLDAARGGIYMAPNEADFDPSPYGEDDVVVI